MDRRLLLSFAVLWISGCLIIPLLTKHWFDTRNVVHVVLLAGDDNVEGYARLSHLSEFMDNADSKTLERFQHLRSVENHSNWTARDDVVVFYERERHEPWHVGPLNIHDYGAQPGFFGPEVEVGHTLGEAFDEPVVIVKAGFSKRSLAEEWISPSRHENILGYAWVHTLKNLKYALQNVGEVLGPEYRKHRTQLVGIIWWHGYSDVVSFPWLSSYYENLKILVRDLRMELGRPHLPIVVAAAGAGGRDADLYRFEKPLRTAQERMCSDAEFADQTVCVQTYPFVHPQEKHIDRHFRYYGHGDSMIEIGGMLGDALTDMYYKQYEHKELQEEIEADYNAYVEETESSTVLILLVTVVLVLVSVAVVRGRFSRRTLYTTAVGSTQGEELDPSLIGDDLGQSRAKATERRRRWRNRRSRRGRETTTSRVTEMTLTNKDNYGGGRTAWLEEGAAFTSIPANDSALMELDEISSSDSEED